MGIVSTLLRAATWWNGQTLNTQLFTWRRGVKVGEDDAGNMFYETKDRVKRWVIFNGEAEASRVSLIGTDGCITHGMNHRPRHHWPIKHGKTASSQPDGHSNGPCPCRLSAQCHAAVDV
jgi:NADH:ubiquinone oxidoreductase subunit